MLYNQNLPEYSDYMYLQGYQPHEILEAFRRTNRKKKREESIFEKEMFNLIEGLATATINKAVEDMFEPFQ